MSGLVNGLQNRVHPFESGRHLSLIFEGSTILYSWTFFLLYIPTETYGHHDTFNGRTCNSQCTYVRCFMHVTSVVSCTYVSPPARVCLSASETMSLRQRDYGSLPIESMSHFLRRYVSFFKEVRRPRRTTQARNAFHSRCCVLAAT